MYEKFQEGTWLIEKWPDGWDRQLKLSLHLIFWLGAPLRCEGEARVEKGEMLSETITSPLHPFNGSLILDVVVGGEIFFL